MSTRKDAALRLPCRFGKYELLEHIGSGGMAEVYKAMLPGIAGFQKTVVIKRLHPKFADQQEFVQLFVEEAKLAAEVQHKNIVSVFDLASLDNGEVYMAMEYISGTDLKNVLRNCNQSGIRLPPWLSVHIVAEMLEALQFAHELQDAHGRPRNIVHCDVSPENLFLSEGGEVKLGDFGVAQDDSRPNDPFEGQLKGKVPYMSAEQIRGRRPDRRSDVFSAGIVLWECLAQRRLFSTTSQSDTMRRIIYAPRTPPSNYSPDVPPELDALVLGALEPDVECRIPTASAMQSRLLEILESLRPRHTLSDVRACFAQVFPKDARTSCQEVSEIIDIMDSAILEHEDVSVPWTPPSELNLNPAPPPAALRTPHEVWLAMGGDPNHPPPRLPPSRLGGRTATRRAILGSKTSADAFTYGILNPNHGVERLGAALPVVAPIKSPPGGVETEDILVEPPPRMPPAAPVAPYETLLPGTPAGGAQPVPRVDSAAARHPLWVRAPGGNSIGPFGPREALETLRSWLDNARTCDVQVCADGGHWMGADRLGGLLGDSAVDADLPVPDGSPQGEIEKHSLVSVFGLLAANQSNAQLWVDLETSEGRVRRELTIQSGHLLGLSSSRDPFELWTHALSSGPSAKLLQSALHRVILQDQPLTAVATAQELDAIRPLRMKLTQAHLQTVFAAGRGQFAVIATAAASPSFESTIPLLRLLPSVVSRARHRQDLKDALEKYAQVPLVRTEDFEALVSSLQLPPSDLARLAPLGHGSTLAESLVQCTNPRDEKLALVLAYILVELGLLTPAHAQLRG